MPKQPSLYDQLYAVMHDHGADPKRFHTEVERIRRLMHPESPEWDRGGRPSLRQQVFAACDAIWPKKILPQKHSLQWFIRRVGEHLADQWKQDKPVKKIAADTIRLHVVEYILRTKTPDQVPQRWLHLAGNGKHIPQRFGLWAYQVQNALQNLRQDPAHAKRVFNSLETRGGDYSVPEPQRSAVKGLVTKLRAAVLTK
jgi:hypothetical protein